jgi:hypothetical protein
VPLRTTASVTPAEPVAVIDSPDAELLSGSGVSVGVWLGVSLGSSVDGLEEAAGSAAVSPPSSPSPQAVSAVASASPVTRAARERVRVRAPERRGEVVMMI